MGYIVTVKYIAEVTGAPHGAQIQKIYFPVPGAAPATPPATRYTVVRSRLRPKRRQPSVIPFTEFEGMKPPYSNLLKEAGPDQYYDLLVPEEILEMIAEQTNLFASQNITARQTKPGSSGKNIDAINTTPTNVVMALCENIFDKGHTLATDNWYTSLQLAYRLLEKQTHLIGTLRKNRRGLPKAVVDSKLQKGETMAMENEDGVTVLKWKDKRDVLMLSTKHSDKIAVVVKKGKQIRKPKVILDYNKSKGSVDMSDQMGAYSSPLRKTVKWYRKLAIELLLNTAVVNAWVMYNENKQSKSSIVDFRRALINYLTRPADSQEIIINERPKRLKHVLKLKEGKARGVIATKNQRMKFEAENGVERVTDARRTSKAVGVSERTVTRILKQNEKVIQLARC
ncbi:PiggyBac transposable element-derived protein 4 [Eumeta japonica]|uniref:PiggyBac transposable element-derived protein 4 n=1 Tax=Eumeta variegata TaxID=151549 RepID=A0A4C2AEJ3_EUMVA|nr:PiggyBac transposable element-derived protein 4 [Eumeta japonica]